MMINWKIAARMENYNVLETVIAYDFPDDDAKEACRKLGKLH